MTVGATAMPFLLCRVVHHQCSGSVVYRLLTVVVLLGFEKHVLCNVVDVANVPELVESLNDSSVTVAQLVKNISLSSKLWPTQITLTRNVTIRGGPDFPVLDLNYLLQRVRLYPGVVLVFDQVELQDIVKRLSSSISLLREASQSSSVVLLNSLRRQSVCLPLSVRQSIMEQSPRLPSFPGVQQFRMTDQTWCRWELDNLQRGKCFPAPNGLYVNTAVLVPFNEESREGGYGFIHLNTTLLCDTMVSQECLTQGRGPVDCYDEAMEKFERQSRSGGSSADPRVVVPVAVVGGVDGVGRVMPEILLSGKGVEGKSIDVVMMIEPDHGACVGERSSDRGYKNWCQLSPMPGCLAQPLTGHQAAAAVMGGLLLPYETCRAVVVV